MSLTDIASIVEIIGIFAILYGLFFGAAQLKQNRVQRRDLALLECTRLFETEEFTDAYRLAEELPVGINRAQLDKLDDRYRTAVFMIAMKFESIGMLVHRGVVPFDAMDDLVGGAVLAIWETLKDFIRETRQTTANPRFMEWYEWLVDRLQERNPETRQPAYIAYKSWREPRV